MTLKKKEFLKNTILFLPFFIFLCLGQVYPLGQDEAAPENKEGWSIIQTAYFTVYYKPDANLKRITSRLNTRWFTVNHKPPSNALTGPEEKLAYRLDMILTKVKEILDMYPANIHINLMIYKNRKEINGEYCKLSKTSDDCRSFYIYSYNTIYTSEQDISDSILAHEMTHALVDNYFSVTPPEKAAEILAQDVDLHLDD